MQGVKELQNSIIGRVLLKSGEKPMPINELKSSLDNVWNIRGDWKIVTLGKGFFNIQIMDLREQDRIFLKRSWPFKFGTIRLQRWVPEFIPYKVSSPLVNVWVRIYDCQWSIFMSLLLSVLLLLLVKW